MDPKSSRSIPQPDPRQLAEHMQGYSETTRGITVTVRPVFLESRSAPLDHQYFWAYFVRIENHGSEPVQLMRRYWRITDSLGRVHEVRGDGVVGQQPMIEPGETFEYDSGTPLATPSGIMVGSYQVVTKAGHAFDIAVPAFSLDSPHQRIHLN
jgi:ApaG protein